jgi:ATP-binding cassette, subfamily B, bacterial
VQLPGWGWRLLVYAGGLATRIAGLSPGDWYLFMQAVGFYWWPLINIASFWSQFQDGLSAAERAFALIDAQPKVVQERRSRWDGSGARSSFATSALLHPTEVVLPGFCLDIRPGETVALVGHTGAGKSSVARLIGRFYEFQDGQLLIDGHDIRRLDLDDYRRQVGVVPQEPFLFSGRARQYPLRRPRGHGRGSVGSCPAHQCRRVA